MDHLKEDYGIGDIQVELTASDAFFRAIDPPKTKEDFHTFPKVLGWKLDSEYKLDIIEVSSKETPAPKPHNLDTLLTVWLFFGLISVII